MRRRTSDTAKSAGRGWGPFTSRQLTTIVCVAIIAAVLIPTAAMAAIGTFTSTTVTPAVTATNSSTAVNAKGIVGTASATSTNARWGVVGTAGGTNGIGVQGGGTKYGVFSNGPLGVAAGKPLNCAGCVGPGALASTIRRERAYAYVDGNATVVGARSFNISVARDSVNDPGIYCVQVTGVDSTTIAPIVTVSDTPFTGFLFAADLTFAGNVLTACPAAYDFVVFTRRIDNGAYTDSDFMVMVP